MVPNLQLLFVLRLQMDRVASQDSKKNGCLDLKVSIVNKSRKLFLILGHGEDKGHVTKLVNVTATLTKRKRLSY